MRESDKVCVAERGEGEMKGSEYQSGFLRLYELSLLEKEVNLVNEKSRHLEPELAALASYS